MEKIISIVKEILSREIPIISVGLTEKGYIYYEVNGFSKSGTAKIWEEDGKIICETRYNTIDEIETFEDLANVAYRWNSVYRDWFGWDGNWLSTFKEFGREVELP